MHSMHPRADYPSIVAEAKDRMQEVVRPFKVSQDPFLACAFVLHPGRIESSGNVLSFFPTFEEFIKRVEFLNILAAPAFVESPCSALVWDLNGKRESAPE